VRDGRQQVVILYSHALLGEGLERMLAEDPALDVELVRVTTLDEAERALTCSPDVVILERTPPFQALDLMRLAPSALVIDVGLDAGPSWTWRRDELAPQPEELLRVIHGRAHPLDGSPMQTAPVTSAKIAGSPGPVTAARLRGAGA